MSDLRIAVLGVGMMGADHVARITGRISGARVAVINDYVSEKAQEVAASVPGARVAADPFDAINADDVDAMSVKTRERIEKRIDPRLGFNKAEVQRLDAEAKRQQAQLDRTEADIAAVNQQLNGVPVTQVELEAIRFLTA